MAKNGTYTLGIFRVEILGGVVTMTNTSVVRVGDHGVQGRLRNLGFEHKEERSRGPWGPARIPVQTTSEAVQK